MSCLPAPISHQPATSPPQKLRSSCDSCAATKVRCDRGQPECGRCSTQKLSCVYGPSRKTGKPPRKRLRTGGEPGLPVPEKGPCLPSSKFTTRLDDQGHNDQAGLTSSLTFPPRGQDPFSNSFPDILDLSDWPAYTQDLDQFLCPSDHPTLTLEASNPAPFTDNNHVFPGGNSDRQSHSCPRESYEIFRDLICPTPALHAPESSSATVSARFDEVLRFNASAIARLARLLECPCAKSGHRAMVHASAISRILIWYQQAAAACTTGASSDLSPPQSPSPSVPGSAAGSDVAADGPSLAKATGFAVEPVAISVGNFGVEDRGLQAVIRTQVLLGELGKAGRLIDDFAAGSEHGDVNDMPAMGLYAHLGGWLKTEHSRTVGVLKSRLCMLLQE